MPFKFIKIIATFLLVAFTFQEIGYASPLFKAIHPITEPLAPATKNNFQYFSRTISAGQSFYIFSNFAADVGMPTDVIQGELAQRVVWDMGDHGLPNVNLHTATVTTSLETVSTGARLALRPGSGQAANSI